MEEYGFADTQVVTKMEADWPIRKATTKGNPPLFEKEKGRIDEATQIRKGKET